jgi:hypothetical protein
MGIDQARHHDAASAVDDSRASGRRIAVRVNGRHHIAFDQYLDRISQGSCLAVKQTSLSQHQLLRGRRLRACQTW